MDPVPGDRVRKVEIIQEKRHSTVYTVFHFWLVNLNIYLNTVSLFTLLLHLTKMKNFNMTVCGIYPYALYMFLKTCINQPTEQTNYWFMPMPMKRRTVGLIVALLSLWFSTETQGCIIVLLYFLLKTLALKIFSYCGCKCGLLKKEGPMFPCLFRVLEKWLYCWASNRSDFVSMSSVAAK